MTPPVRLDHPAGQHRPIRLEPLASDFQTELVEPAERGQVSAGEASATSSVGQVEVSQMDGVRTPIIGETSTPLQGPSTPGPYTLNREEPVMAACASSTAGSLLLADPPITPVFRPSAIRALQAKCTP